jgi:polysaccharide deacetylase family protein (PEP-CTERM system associated)
MPAGTTSSIFSIDVEDWFHILDLPSTPELPEWDGLPSRVESNFRRLLDLLSEANARATCFFLGYVGRRFPHLVQEAVGRGHEIASHGFAHRLAYEQTAREFYEDIAQTKRILEDASGQPVRGYRSPGFSATERSPWFFDQIARAGYEYDSSVFPAPRGHGGLKTDRFAPHKLRTREGLLVEFPVTVAEVWSKPICFFGGGYLRLFAYPIVRRMSQAVLSSGRPVIFYVHPREIDPEQPRLPMGPGRAFKSYVNIRGTESKIRSVLRDFPVTTFADYLAAHGAGMETYETWSPTRLLPSSAPTLTTLLPSMETTTTP